MAEIASSSNDTSFVITIDDTSPTFVYSPFADTFGTPNLTAGWNPYYSETAFTPNPLTGEGNGTSLHVTSADGASLSLRWNGECFLLCMPLVSPRVHNLGGILREPQTLPLRAWRGVSGSLASIPFQFRALCSRSRRVSTEQSPLPSHTPRRQHVSTSLLTPAPRDSHLVVRLLSVFFSWFPGDNLVFCVSGPNVHNKLRVQLFRL